MTAFDYIIVGAGSAGCVMANRLSADPAVSVCLVEAGGSDRSPWIRIPAGIFGLYGNRKYDYTFRGVPQKHLNNRSMTVNRGKVLGGSSAINSMVYIRGNRNDYENWKAQGCSGWGYEDVLPVFMRQECNLAGQSPEYHGFRGELNVVEPQDVTPLARRFVAAAADAGLPENTDFNAGSQLGLGIYNVNQNRGVRLSSYNAFVEPVQERPNLTILTHTEVYRLVIEGDQVRAVVLEQPNGQRSTITCQREVILCAGTIASPRILLASGIGPADALRALGIACRLDVPGVGENLQDHIDSMVTVRSDRPVSIGISAATLLPHVFPAPFQYWLQRRGWWTTNYVEAGGFARTPLAGADPDVQFHFTPIYRSHRGRRFEFGHGYSVFTCVLRPRSRGSIRLAPDGTHKNVLIDHNFFADEQDQRVLVAGVRKAREILASRVFDGIRGVEMAPGREIQSDARLLDYLRHTTTTVYHPVGTCRMGLDAMAVVSPQNLKVHGMQNLRVADASIMPSLISGNTSAPSMMIGDMGAAMVLGRSDKK
ncbi:MAG: GMC family oxidoreductase N-terminal domain-containing protein [Thiothrix sp.]|nr:GMC family oxidoreductase N-terminal domain-containing protein [Thiothrix sp.]HPQ94252.1 GMC family oxidoreductase N-terminal domain-containing protein [Thiolinea sp.]